MLSKILISVMLFSSIFSLRFTSVNDFLKNNNFNFNSNKKININEAINNLNKEKQKIVESNEKENEIFNKHKLLLRKLINENKDLLEKYNLIGNFNTFLLSISLTSNLDLKLLDKIAFEYLEQHEEKKYVHYQKENCYTNLIYYELVRLDDNYFYKLAGLLDDFNQKYKTNIGTDEFMDHLKSHEFYNETIRKFDVYISFMKKYQSSFNFNYLYLAIPSILIGLGILKKMFF